MGIPIYPRHQLQLRRELPMLRWARLLERQSERLLVHLLQRVPRCLWRFLSLPLGLQGRWVPIMAGLTDQARKSDKRI